MTKKKNPAPEVPAAEDASAAVATTPLELDPVTNDGQEIEDEIVAGLRAEGLKVDARGDVVDASISPEDQQDMKDVQTAVEGTMTDGEAVFTATSDELQAAAEQQGSISEEQALKDKDAISSAFSKAAPVTFKEPETTQRELLPPENMTRKLNKFTMELVVHFTEEEEMQHGQLVYGLIIQKAQIEDEKADVAKGFKARIDVLEAQIAELAEVGKAKGEKRAVQCEEVVDYIGGLAITRRMDTMEEVKRRPLEKNELQQELALVSRQETKNTSVIRGNNVVDGPWGRSNAAPKVEEGASLLDTDVTAGELCEKLMALPGVEEVQVFENETDTEDEDKRPPHSVEVFIDGGDGVEIANKIVELLPLTVRLHGNTTVMVTTKEHTIQVLFSRPDAKAMPAPIVDAAPAGEPGPLPDVEPTAQAPASEDDELWPLEGDDKAEADIMAADPEAQPEGTGEGAEA